jgi:hypothetical protein
MLRLMPLIVSASLASIPMLPWAAAIHAEARSCGSACEIRDWSPRVAQADPCNCNSVLRTRIATCNTVFPPASRSREHTQCLQKARDEFDACRKAC